MVSQRFTTYHFLQRVKKKCFLIVTENSCLSIHSSKPIFGRHGNCRAICLFIRPVDAWGDLRLLISYFTQAGSLTPSHKRTPHRASDPAGKGRVLGCPFLRSFQPTPPTTLFLIGNAALYVKLGTHTPSPPGYRLQTYLSKKV